MSAESLAASLTNSGAGPLTGGALSPATLLDSLLSFYELDETSGTRVSSHAGGTNIIEIGGTVGSTTGLSGNAAISTGGELDVENAGSGASELGGLTAITITGWVKVNSAGATPGTNNFLLLRESTGVPRLTLGGYYPGTPTGRLTIFSRLWDSGNVERGFGPDFVTVTHPNWVFLAVAANHGEQRAFYSFNGGSFVEGSWTGGTSVINLTSIPRLQITNSSFTDLAFDKVAVFNKILSSAELTYLYNGGSGRAYSEIT